MTAVASETPKPLREQGTSPAPARLTSLDAYRGLVMLLMMAEALDLSRVAQALPSSALWKFLAHHQSHAEWIGCSLHDLIQPSFSFLVGVALPFSLASRAARGQSRTFMTLHAAWRALMLVLLGAFLASTNQSMTCWDFEDTLSQIGLGYVFLFLLAARPVRDQWIALGVILAGYWAAFVLYPLPGASFDYPSVGVPRDWSYLLSGFAAHWNKNCNLAWAFDTRFLNLFPRPAPFVFNAGGYATLSFIPTLGTMVLGLIAAGVIRSQRLPWAKVRWLATAGVVCLAAGTVLGWLGVCPVVKRIWTPSWTLFSGGWCLVLMAGFYLLLDLWGLKRWSFPLVVIGMNSIAAYCMVPLCGNFIGKSLRTHLGPGVFKLFGRPYEPLLYGGFIVIVMWLLLYWMYRRKLFLRI
jgi:heparan-alpha-glucosaminide N-acetyltransferase